MPLDLCGDSFVYMFCALCAICQDGRELEALPQAA
jgi:hypothetical protein